MNSPQPAGPTIGTGRTQPRGRTLVAQVAAPLRSLMANQASSAGLLLTATVIALIWANSPWAATYAEFWETQLAVRVGNAELALDLRHWVNDGLMVFFFFVVGLEVKRELAIGELTDRRRAAIPVVAALTGLAVPALIFLAFNPTGAAAQAWGAVISTDTAFLLGVLVLVGPACPLQLRLFLLTLAVADDVGALTIIAVFYTDHLAIGPLLLAVAGLGLMLVLRFGLKVWRGPAYGVVGVGIWIAMYASGVHPTIAGVVIALFSPAYRPRRDDVEDAERLTRAFRQSPNAEFARAARLSIDRSVSGTERLQLLYQPWSSFVIVPVFALANAGVTLDATALRAAWASPVTLGVIAGLVLGKGIGVTFGVAAAVRLRLGTLAPGLGAWQLAGGAALSGIGFTISLFIIDLSLPDRALADQARIGVLVGSLLAAALGWGVFRLGDRLRGPQASMRPTRLDPPVDVERDHIRGPVDAPLTLVEFGDFECPFCGRATGVVEELRERFGDRLRYVFRHIPLEDVHPHAMLAAEAAEAAAAQGHFWAMHDRLFAHQDALSALDLLDHAAAVGLDVQRFSRDLGDARYARRVRDDAASAEASGVGSTPTFFVGGHRHTDPYDAETLAARLLASAGGLGVEPAHRDGAPMAVTTPMLGNRRSDEQRGEQMADATLPEGDRETDDPDGSFPRLPSELLDLLERHGVRRSVAVGDVLFREGDPGYDFFVVLDGLVAVVEDLDRASSRVLSVSGTGRFLGELNLLGDQPVFLSAVVTRPGTVIDLDVAGLRAAFAESPRLHDIVLRAFLLRRSHLLADAADLRVIGRGADPLTGELRRWAAANAVTHAFTDLDEDTGAGSLLDELGVAATDTPMVTLRDGTILRRPSTDDLGRALG
ncbi:Na+/H+ antiporter NhaA [Pseudonocardia sp. GCM10023141]|uniref:Na+/H+ antiporter NhaA n=1 Tax=Pseudonocardia sp. GCM10023141 TaxID=3252653 RepID=UPI00360F6019